MKKFLLRQKGIEKAIGKFDSKVEAVDVMDGYIEDNNDNLDSDDEGYLTPFDFTLDEIEDKEINELVTNYEEARKYLGGKPNADFAVTKKLQSNNSLDLSGVAHLVDEMNPRHLKALAALNKLFTIAEAWNKADDFVPDFSNQNQYKYYPWFVYDRDAAGFVSALRMMRLRIRMRFSVLGFALRPQIGHGNSVKCLPTCTTKCSFSNRMCFIVKQIGYGKRTWAGIQEPDST